MKMEDTFRTQDGLVLRGREWPCANAKGSIVLVHGLGEHLDRHAHVAAFLNDEGWRVIAYDQRGHGRSEGRRGALARGDDLLADLAHVVDTVRARHSGPLLLLGHSLGGLVAARFVAGDGETPRPAWWRRVDSLVLSSPALDPGLSPMQAVLLATLGTMAPNLALGNGLKPRWLSRNDAVVAAYVADPLVHDRITPRLARFIVDAGRFVRACAPRWVVPTLVLHAGSDRCVAPQGSAAFVAAAPAAVVQANAFPPLFHEIFNEPEQAEVFSVLGAWLDTLNLSPTRSLP